MQPSCGEEAIRESPSASEFITTDSLLSIHFQRVQPVFPYEGSRETAEPVEQADCEPQETPDGSGRRRESVITSVGSNQDPRLLTSSNASLNFNFFHNYCVRFDKSFHFECNQRF